jgi:SAM-dependent methyltransferase
VDVSSNQGPSVSVEGAPNALGTPPQAYKKALRILKKPGAKRVLDCPAGQGAFAKLLLQSGYHVSCGDVQPEQFKIPEVFCAYTNLNDKIPFEDNSFDALTCLNGLQRIWARGRAFSEMARVLKPGGRLVLTMFNNNTLMRRMMFMVSGSITYDTIEPPYVCIPDAEDPAACFRYPITVADIVGGIESVGLTLRTLDAVLWSKGSLIIAPLAVGAFLMRPFVPGVYKKHGHLRESSLPRVLFNDCLVVEAIKPIV